MIRKVGATEILVGKAKGSARRLMSEVRIVPFASNAESGSATCPR
jgi:hypothetical protein